MSTATLLIVTARLRSIACADGHERPASSVTLYGRGRATRSVALTSIAHSTAGAMAVPRRRGSPGFPLSGRAPRAAAFAALAALPFLLTAGSARAQDAPATELPPVRAEAVPDAQPAPRIGGKPPAGPCVQVDIGGHRAGHLDCATQALQAAARSAQGEARAGLDLPVISAGSPDVATGVAHEGASRLRMGDALGRSVHPERPAPPRWTPRP